MHACICACVSERQGVSEREREREREREVEGERLTCILAHSSGTLYPFCESQPLKYFNVLLLPLSDLSLLSNVLLCLLME